MKIVVIGGTGLIGSKLVENLRHDGHEAVAASPDTGVNTLTGEGLGEALEGAQVVVDVANAPAWDDDAVLNSSRPRRATCSPRKPPRTSDITSRCRSSAPTGCLTAATSARRSRKRSS
jgi:nucleoside-diphosphate-sugar epimerase